MTNTNDSKEEDRRASKIAILYLAMPFVLGISILVVVGYILEERLGVFIEEM